MLRRIENNNFRREYNNKISDLVASELKKSSSLGRSGMEMADAITFGIDFDLLGFSDSELAKYLDYLIEGLTDFRKAL